MLSSVQRAEGQSDGCISITRNYEDTTWGAVPADQGCICAEEVVRCSIDAVFGLWCWIAASPALVRSRDEHSGLTGAPLCAPALCPSFCWQHNRSSSRPRPLMWAVAFFFGCFLNHTPLSFISAHANGTLSQSSLSCSVCNDGSHQWLHWICILSSMSLVGRIGVHV